MKIGILTQPLLNNYGGLLQNYALQQVLKRMGHEVETVDWEPAKPSIREWLWRKKLLFLSYFKKDIIRHKYELTEAESVVIGKHTNLFVSRYISTIPQKIHTLEEMAGIDAMNRYDAYVVGSDQVWRPCYNSFMFPAMFLNFVNRKEVKRVAYAASFGTSNWELTEQQTVQCAKLAKKFDLITVRELSGIKLCKENLGVDAALVLDPTMLLDKEDYIRVVEAEQEPISAGTLFHYILDPTNEKKALVNGIASNQGLLPFTVMPKFQQENRTKEDVKKRINDCVFPSVTSWLRGFMDAKMVIVDSFHGTVFSIIFNKPFWVLGNEGRGNARFESLLGLFGLQDRMISFNGEVDWDKKIDWKKVNEIRQKEKEKSLGLLIDVMS